MARRACILATGVLVLMCGGSLAQDEASFPFQRGDFNGDSHLDISDPVFILIHLFLGGAPTWCEDAGDVNDDGALDITDATLALEYLFLRGLPPKPPFPECAEDPTPDKLNCVYFTPCSMEKNEVVAIRSVNSGIEVELFSTREFMPRALPPLLCTGNQEIWSARHPPDGSLNTIIFTLTREEFARIETGDPVSVQHGVCGRDFKDQRMYWDLWVFGFLDKSMLDQE